jgi:outer membrane protein assembly factor BamB
VGRGIVNYDCKLERIEKEEGREIAIVSYKATIKKDEDEKPAKDQRLGKIDGTASGIGRFDVAQGAFVEIKSETQAKIEMQAWWSKDLTTPLMKIDVSSKETMTSTSVADRKKHKAEITQRVAAAEAKRAAEEAEAMAGPVDPPTPPNEPVAWLQWGGPNRDFKSTATGLANRWPKGGPAKLWERPLGDGYSAILCDGETLYTTYSIRDKADPLKGNEFIAALDAKTGKTIWEHKYDAPRPKELSLDFGPGPHSTPIIVGDKIFSVDCTVKLYCLNKKTGKLIWNKDLHKEYKAGMHMHGYGSSPLAVDGNILLPVSKEKGHSIMAFKQSDGSVAWKGGEFEPGYASLMIINMDGIEQLIAFSGKALMGLNPGNASTLWSVDQPTQWGANITSPVWDEKNKHLFISSAYGMGSRGVKLEKAGSQIAAKEAWFNPKMKIHHADAICLGDWIYGSSGDFGPAFLACVNTKTGEFGWRKRGIAKANVVYADGKIIAFDEDGALYLVKADPTKYRLLGKMPGLCKKTAWTVPTLVGRTLYLRDREKILALDLGVQKSSM